MTFILNLCGFLCCHVAVGCSGLELATFQPCCILRQIKCLFYFFYFYSVKVSLADMTFVKFPNNNLICLIFEILINRSLQMMVIMVISCLLN